MMLGFIAFAATISAVVLGFAKTREFVRKRLRYVEAVHSSSAPFKAGGAAMLLAVPVVWVLPIVGAPAAVLSARPWALAWSPAAGIFESSCQAPEVSLKRVFRGSGHWSDPRSFHLPRGPSWRPRLPGKHGRRRSPEHDVPPWIRWLLVLGSGLAVWLTPVPTE
jgi:hypothetical protein